MIRVVEPGSFTTVQDLGRAGLAAIGVPPSGAFDEVAFRLANLLAGNTAVDAALEITFGGPLLNFEGEAVVAIAGAHCDAELDGRAVSFGESIRVPAGAALRLGRPREGLRTYLAVRGGILVPEMLLSRSTLVSAGFGGWLGRPLAANDYLRVGHPPNRPMRRLIRNPVEHYGVVRAVPGPQSEAFTERGRTAFFNQPFTISPRSDRVGVRLDGEPLELARPADLDPEGVVTGSVQVPGDGLPIVLGPDRPVTGGYAKIATVITADLPKIAQARPGDTLRFVPTTPEEARTIWLEQERALLRAIKDVG